MSASDPIRETRPLLPTELFRAEQVRELDRLAIAEAGISGFTLMRRAAQAAFHRLLKVFPDPEQLTIVCGTGNNGGDGYAMASLARRHGIPCQLLTLGDCSKIGGEALQARQLAQQDGVPMAPFNEDLLPAGGVLVDALLGTGLSGEVRPEYAAAITAINDSGLAVLAVDIPSGLCSDSGRVLGTAVVADVTVSFIGLKRGLLTGQAPDYVGELVFAGLDVPTAVLEKVPVSVERLAFAELSLLLAPRSRCAHKGHFGHIMVAGGDHGMAGAAALASQAACRVGAGLVSCATRPEHISAILARCPEVMTHGVISGQEVEPLLSRATVVVVGPGLGRGPWGEQLLQKVCALEVPLVLDADALNILSAGRVLKNACRDNWILTPHPAEAARLLGCSTADVQSDRFAAVAALQQRYGGVAILKGAGSLVADGDGDPLGLCSDGNPGMASGGMGDVLSGILGGLLAQGLSPAAAARLGVCLHAVAADRAALAGERGLQASDVIAELRALVN